MNKILRNLTIDCFENKKYNVYFRICGNYKISKDLHSIAHFYYGHLICYVDLEKNNFELYSCGYKNYRLTTAQLNFLEKYYKGKGFNLKLRD